MIEKMIKIHGIGALHDAIPQLVDFKRITAIYGENGRGKTTMSAVLTSLRTGDSSHINARPTIDGTNEPAVQMKLNGEQFVEFKKNIWSATCAEICVFDATFVDANVYSGFEISSDHRRKLLDFALGEKGVELKQIVDELTEKISKSSADIRIQDAKISGTCRPMSVTDFLGLAEDQEIDSKIEAAEKEVGVAKKAKEIAERSTLSESSAPSIDTSAIKDLLDKALPQISADARQRVERHLREHMQHQNEQWIRAGVSLLKGESCPFCEQPLAPARELMDAYSSYFDESYATHVEELKKASQESHVQLSDEYLARLNRLLGNNETLLEFWKSVADMPSLSTPGELLAEKIKGAREKLDELIKRKIGDPLTPLDAQSEIDEIATCMEAIVTSTVTYNAEIGQINAKISTIKADARSSNLDEATKRLNASKLQKQRFEEATKKECDQLSVFQEQKKKLEKEKKEAREAMEQYTTALLGKYENAINIYLEQFGADFKIVEVSTSNEGGLPRVNYKLQIGSQAVSLGASEQTAGKPVFANALSEGDKRTLALAFFLAKLDVDGKLEEQIIILDDPVCSLDQPRRWATYQALLIVARAAKQLVVLSHDALFVQSMCENLDLRSLGITVLELRRASGNYSVLEICDIEERVQSEYKANYRTLVSYTNGEREDKQKVVRAIRPMLEANLKHRFQDDLRGAYSLGRMIEAIRNCQASSPLSRMQFLLPKLETINGFVTENFTHDVNGDGTMQQLDDAQLRLYSTQALDIARGVHQQSIGSRPTPQLAAVGSYS